MWDDKLKRERRMTPQEVVDSLGRKLTVTSREDWLETLSEAIRYTGKNIPEKPVPKKIDSCLVASCPNCRQIITMFDMNYCHNCGQRFNWMLDDLTEVDG